MRKYTIRKLILSQHIAFAKRSLPINDIGNLSRAIRLYLTHAQFDRMLDAEPVNFIGANARCEAVSSLEEAHFPLRLVILRG